MGDDCEYRLVRLTAIALAGREWRVATRPALGEVASASPVEQLLAAQAQLIPGQRVLVSPCGHGLVAAWAAATCGPERVVAMDTDAIALDLTRQTLAANGLAACSAVAGAPAGGAAEPFEVGLLALPKGRALARLHLLGMALSLAPGGELYLAGANNAGIQSVLGDAERLLGPGELLAYRKGHRVARFRRPPLDPTQLPAPFDEPGLLPGTYRDVPVVVGPHALTLRSRPGVFSHGELDAGTAMLLANLRVHPGERVLDWGCGAGVIGLVAALIAGPEAVTLLDVDALACECAAASLAANGLAGVRVILGDGLAALPEGERLDLIVSNPPFHSGHEVNLRITAALIAEAFAALEPRGRLVLVANRFLPYGRLLSEVFGAVETLAADGRYQVLSAAKSRARRPVPRRDSSS
ncbi:MAG: methyltransferase [Anaerolineales bacterium]